MRLSASGIFGMLMNSLSMVVNYRVPTVGPESADFFSAALGLRREAAWR